MIGLLYCGFYLFIYTSTFNMRIESLRYKLKKMKLGIHTTKIKAKFSLLENYKKGSLKTRLKYLKAIC